LLTQILIVDDNELVRRELRDILTVIPNCSVCGEASEGLEAVNKGRELKPDLILLDLNMPGISGLEAAGFLHESLPAAKIIILSQNDPVLLLPSALRAGAHACLDKSKVASELVPFIEHLTLSL
jgi:two-component system, NarL family, nitrate/nitrite response regulator NarL